MSDSKPKKVVSISYGENVLKLEVATLLFIFSLLLGGGAAVGIGGVGNFLSRDVPTDQTVNQAATSIVAELRQIRREMNSLQGLRYQVEDNTALIDSLKAYQQQMKAEQRRGFGALWEQNKQLLGELHELRGH